MKIRTGFVSNSSSSSFLIYGVSVEEDDLNKYILTEYKNEIDEYLKQTNKTLKDCDLIYEFSYDLDLEDCQYLAETDEYFIGLSPQCGKNDETFKEFKDNIKNKIKAILGEKIAEECDWISRTWYS